MQHAAKCFGRDLKFHNNAIARRPRVSASAGGAGSWLNARAILTTPTISHAHNAWRERNPDYWRKYRREHPDYSERNRTQQRERNDRRRERLIAKMDVSTPVFPIPSGIYQISQATPAGIAKMDAWTVQITLLPSPYDQPAEDCKERT